ncbi:MAG: DUF4065 domain-containing protein [Fermentimonas sp.]|jgi:hypothetical protein|nr:DUF4065 domain-containing protein [Fermentimonas sp.]
MQLDFKELLLQILHRKEIIGMPILKTRLIKLAYLVEVEFYRSFRTRISNTEWVYYKYGPYVHSYDSILIEREFEWEASGQDDEYSIIKPRFSDSNVCLENRVNTIINRVVNKYGRLDLPSLLDHVYFNTEPMMYVTDINASLDFSLVLHKNAYSDKSGIIPESRLRGIKDDLRGRLANVRKL